MLSRNTFLAEAAAPAQANAPPDGFPNVVAPVHPSSSAAPAGHIHTNADGTMEMQRPRWEILDDCTTQKVY